MFSQMIQDRGRFIKYSAFLNSAILELFLFSFSGNKLIDEVSKKIIFTLFSYLLN